MATPDNLSGTDEIESSDLLAVWSSRNRDSRRVSYGQFRDAIADSVENDMIIAVESANASAEIAQTAAETAAGTVAVAVDELRGEIDQTVADALAIPLETAVSAAALAQAASETATTAAQGAVDALTSAVKKTDLSGNTGSALVGYQAPGDGGVIRSQQEINRERVSVKDFGAKGNGVDDDTIAIQRAINSINSTGGGIVYFPAGTYMVGSIYTLPAGGGYLDQYMIDLSGRSGITLLGQNKSATIKLKDGFLSGLVDLQSNAHIFSGSSASKITFDGLVFDLNGLNNLTPAGKTRNAIAIRMQSGNALSVRNCRFLNSGGNNVIAAGGTGDGFAMSGCEMINGGAGVTGNVNKADFSFVYSEWSNTVATSNLITQENGPGGFSGGIELHGSDSQARGNVIINCEPAIWIASVPSAISNISVTDNTFKDCNRGVAIWRGYDLKHVTIANNIITIKKWFNASYAIGIPMPANGVYTVANAHAGYIENLVIEGNTISDNSPDLAEASNYGIYLASLKTASIRGNTLSSLNGPGIVLLGSPFGLNDVAISQNTISNCARNTTANGREAFFINLNGTSTTPAASQFFAANLSFTDNTMRNDIVRTGSKAYALAWAAGSMGAIEIKRNEIVNFETTWAGNQGFDYNFAQGVRALIRREFSAVAAPTAGSHTRGDIAWSVFQATSGSPVGWICVATGTPGTWAPFGIAGGVRAAAQADSAAAPTQAEFNALLAKLRAAGLMAP